MVYAGANADSFEQARRDLKNLADLEIKTERVRRATGRHGKLRRQTAERLEKAYLSKPLPEKSRGGPADVEAPPIAVVMSDGGKYQRFDRNQPKPESDSFWRESRVACLLSMTPADYSACDDRLPEFLRDVSIAKKLAEIGHVSGENPKPDGTQDRREPPWQCGEMLGKEVIAAGCNWKEFGPRVASAAWYRGFAKAREKAFVSDGSSAIESMQQQWFSDYTTILDLLHALSYCLASARAIYRDTAEAWQCYIEFAELIWNGRVDQVIAALDEHGQALGDPPEGAAASDPRVVVRSAAVYYRNHRERMNYPEYRRKGYPLTSSIIESTVKQVSHRLKGTEKFWSSPGSEAVLQLRGDYLSDSRPMEGYWRQSILDADGFRCYALGA